IHISIRRCARLIGMSSLEKNLEKHMDRSLQQRVADNVRAEMARYGVSAKQLAEALGMSVQSVSVKRRGDVPFSLNDLELIAPLFGMTPGELVDGNVVYVDFVRRGPRADKRALAPEVELAGADVSESAVASEKEESPAAGATGDSGVVPTGVDPVTFRFSV